MTNEKKQLEFDPKILDPKEEPAKEPTPPFKPRHILRKAPLKIVRTPKLV